MRRGSFRGPSLLSALLLLLGAPLTTSAEPRVCTTGGEEDERELRLLSPSSRAPDVELADAESSTPDASVWEGPGFLYVAQSGGGIACAPRAIAEESLTRLVLHTLDRAGLDPELAIVVTTHPIGCGALFYIPLANDIEGIGYANTHANEIFDTTPDHALEGIVFLNDLPYWETRTEELRRAFLHEVGHRWSARVHALTPEGPLSLTGRENSHWSYFFNSHSSPLEGNTFSPTVPAVTHTISYPERYAPLDLYLMGALPADEVGPLSYLRAEETGELDCHGQQLHSGSPPQVCRELTLPGTFLEFGIDAIIRAEGERVPAYRKRELSDMATTKTLWIVLETGEPRWTSKDCSRFEAMTLFSDQNFLIATNATHRLERVHATPRDCLDFPEPSPAGGCSINTASASPSLWLFQLLGLALYSRRRATRPKSSGER